VITDALLWGLITPGIVLALALAGMVVRVARQMRKHAQELAAQDADFWAIVRACLADLWEEVRDRDEQ
jgi:cytochrome c-type biogenesis protein CcmH/NrfF